jgi:hypothetical protein
MQLFRRLPGQLVVVGRVSNPLVRTNVVPRAAVSYTYLPLPLCSMHVELTSLGSERELIRSILIQFSGRNLCKL